MTSGGSRPSPPGSSVQLSGCRGPSDRHRGRRLHCLVAGRMYRLHAGQRIALTEAPVVTTSLGKLGTRLFCSISVSFDCVRLGWGVLLIFSLIVLPFFRFGDAHSLSPRPAGALLLVAAGGGSTTRGGEKESSRSSRLKTTGFGAGFQPTWSLAFLSRVGHGRYSAEGIPERAPAKCYTSRSRQASAARSAASPEFVGPTGHRHSRLAASV